MRKNWDDFSMKNTKNIEKWEKITTKILTCALNTCNTGEILQKTEWETSLWFCFIHSVFSVVQQCLHVTRSENERSSWELRELMLICTIRSLFSFCVLCLSIFRFFINLNEFMITKNVFVEDSIALDSLPSQIFLVTLWNSKD